MGKGKAEASGTRRKNAPIIPTEGGEEGGGRGGGGGGGEEKGRTKR